MNAFLKRITSLCFWRGKGHFFDGKIGACRKCGKRFGNACIEID